MIIFILGIITGLIIATLIVAVLTFFKNPIQQKALVVQKQIENKGPRPKGFIVEPTSEADEARASIITKNKALGKDTPINDLR